ncbi:MAG: C4-dicarboxylate ABC transporter substrate-binding protein, partial [Armatimonadetes bacterium]|nr:C4-dicarboxylate ABC transporter substrate-binding protein [Armatimonadota bacterium]
MNWCLARTVAIAVLLLAVAASPNLVTAGPAVRLSIATGTTGGVYFPLGGGLASLISKNIPG